MGYYQQALALKPDYGDAYNNFGIALDVLGRLDESVATLEKAVRLKPNDASAHYNLGNALQRLGRLDESVASYERALALNPDYMDVYNNLGAALTHQGKLEEAVNRLQQPVANNPGSAGALNNLGNALKEQGRIDEASSYYRRSIMAQPDYEIAHSNLLVCMNYDPRVTPEQLLAEHRRWDRMFGFVQGAGPLPEHDANPSRRLRIGYLSPDLYFHPVASFFEPIISNHDSGRVETFCYAQVPAPDAVTARLRAKSHHWHNIYGKSDPQVIEQIKADGIDILVDLAGHTGNNRLRLFAHRPAPIQATYLGYPNTTGLRTMDYCITDDVTDPEGEPQVYTEELIRLPGPFCCYQPPLNAPDVSALPASKAGHLTFGSLQNLAKLNPAVIHLWCELLKAVPTARLLIFRNSLKGQIRDRLLSEFTSRGIAADRIELRNSIVGDGGYMTVYRDVDVSLDTFPWSGHTTACESLWMGVPILTCYGDRHAGRMASSILSYLDMDAFVAESPEEFIAKGGGVGGKPGRLGRDAARNSGSTCEHRWSATARNSRRGLEDAYAAMWQRWCIPVG